PTGTDGNVDLYIAQSRDGGRHFLPQNTLHLTDAHLGDEVDGGPEVDQVLPSITVDRFHRVHILYHAMTRTGTSATFRAKWAMIPSFSAGVTPAQVVKAPLAPVFSQPHLNGGGVSSLLDYDMIASSGCLVYAVYVSAHEGTAANPHTMNIYVSKIDLC